MSTSVLKTGLKKEEQDMSAPTVSTVSVSRKFTTRNEVCCQISNVTSRSRIGRIIVKEASDGTNSTFLFYTLHPQTNKNSIFFFEQLFTLEVVGT